MESGMHGRINHINKKEGTCIIETTAGKLKFNKTPKYFADLIDVNELSSKKQ